MRIFCAVSALLALALDIIATASFLLITPFASATYALPTVLFKSSSETVLAPFMKWLGASTCVPLCAQAENALRLYKSPSVIDEVRVKVGAGSPGYTSAENSSWEISYSCMALSFAFFVTFVFIISRHVTFFKYFVK